MSSGLKKVLGLGGVVGLLVAVYLAFFVFRIQTAFIDDVVEDGGEGTAAELEQEELQEIFNSVEFTDAMEDAEANATIVDQAMPTMDGEISITWNGDFMGVNSYDFVGQALVLEDGTGRRVLRFEDFEGQNGPALMVYLRNEAGDFISLGDLQGNIGNQNYEIPESVDLDTYNLIDIWCEPFGVGFGLSQLSPA